MAEALTYHLTVVEDNDDRAASTAIRLPMSQPYTYNSKSAGAVFRSAAALGVDAVLVSPRCADLLYRRSVRVSMGTVFQVPWTRIDPWPEGVKALQGMGFVVAGLTLNPGVISLDQLAADLPDRLALVLGTEGDGLSAAAGAATDLQVRIPMGGGVDSLNVAAASAVAFYATRRRPVEEA